MNRTLVEMDMLKDTNCGIGQFCLQLARSLVERDTERKLTFMVPPGTNASLSGGAAFSTARYSWARRFPLMGPRCSVWHCTHQDSPFLPVRRSQKLVLTVHDLNFLSELEDRPRDVADRLQRLRQKMDRASMVVTDSRFVAEQLEQHLGDLTASLRVIPLGGGEARPEQGCRPDWLETDRPFLFTLGFVAPKKNFLVLVEMLRTLPDYRLIIAGYNRKAYGHQIRRRVAELGMEDRVLLPGVIDDATKWWLYRHCEAFVFPSLLEGFGLPVVEALSVGKPVFLSTHSSVPEVGGEAALYWQEFDPESMRHTFLHGMRRFAESGGEMARRAVQRASEFTWTRCAHAYYQAYQELF